VSASRGWQWDKAATECRRRSQDAQLPCSRCGSPINYTLRWNNRAAFTAGHIDGYEWNPQDPRSYDQAYLQPEHRSCGATHGNHTRQGKTATLVTSEDW
jgi:hypothetical protein